MMDFNSSLMQELVGAQASDREREAARLRWRRLARAERPVARRGLRRVLFAPDAAVQRRRIFAEGLEAAQREGITIDAWFGFRFSDPELSARAEWAGLIDERIDRAEVFAA